MVKIIFTLLLFFHSFAFAEDDIVVEQDPLTTKIQSFLDSDTYENNKAFIDVIFDPKSDFYMNDRVDSVKVIQTLKENGLLKLFFPKPQKFYLHFKTNGSPLFFVKIMEDTLRNIGYFRYVTVASSLDSSAFTWSVAMRSEYATDPLILQKELQKSGCDIIDVQRESNDEWSYVVDISNAFLHVPSVEVKKEIHLKRSLYAHWLDVSKIRTLKITSSIRNSWYPYIAYYDASLHLLKLTKEDRVYKKITLQMPKGTKYIKISDLYTLKNVRDELHLIPTGAR
jgi:hypothetical protein